MLVTPLLACATLAAQGGTAAPRASALPGTTARANDLQRAVWACEAFARAKPPAGTRYVLGRVDRATGPSDRTPLALAGGTLTGLGQVSNDHGWRNVRFACTLTPSLGQAGAFEWTALSPVSAASKTPAATRPAASGYDWFVQSDSRPALVHGVRETDDRDFIATCAPRSGAAEIRLTQTVPSLSAGGYAVIAVTGGTMASLYVARGVPDENLGAVIPVFSVTASDSLFAQIASGTAVSITIGADSTYAVSLNGAAEPVRHFIARCRRG